jgi:hypothetical protein
MGKADAVQELKELPVKNSDTFIKVFLGQGRLLQNGAVSSFTLRMPERPLGPVPS